LLAIVFVAIGRVPFRTPMVVDYGRGGKRCL